MKIYVGLTILFQDTVFYLNKSIFLLFNIKPYHGVPYLVQHVRLTIKVLLVWLASQGTLNGSMPIIILMYCDILCPI